MKEFIHVIRQIFMSTRVIENRVKYQILCWGCSGIHLLFAVLMFLGHVNSLFAINIVATIIYIFLGVVLAAREQYKLLFVIAFLEVELNAALSSVMLGVGYDFMLYTLSLIPGSLYLVHTWPTENNNRYRISLIPIASIIMVAVMYVLVDIITTVFPAEYVDEAIVRFRPFFHYFNIMVAVILLFAFSILFALEVRYIQKLLFDENSRLGEIASRDPLTKAYNRRSLYNIINTEMESNTQLEFGVILLDIDDFKKINDTYGHLVGDQVLIGVSNIMQENLRENDYLCRWGGEEFMLMIHGKSEEYGIVAERIRKAIAEQQFDADGKAFSITVTMGISEYQTGLQLRTLVDAADQKLYFGKNHGKNQVVV